jgi:hypothetical protein
MWVMARRRKRIDEQTRTEWEKGFRSHIAETVSKPRAGSRKAASTEAAPQPSLAPAFVQMCTIQDLPPSIALPLSVVQREMLWAAWHGELWRDGRGVLIAGRRASIVTLCVLRARGLIEKGGGQIGITRDGQVALELLYTDPRQWPTPIEAVTGSLPADYTTT